ncbi:MAG: DUF2892 domain-containing protein [Bdellovibrio sp.]|nr:DUF2892 domain-containing protein [Bdellovibrio sp.]
MSNSNLQEMGSGKIENFAKSRMSVMRQVLLIAASLVFLAFLGAHFIYPGLIYLALLVGVGLFLYGLTGVCPMALLLQKMPWNRQSACHPSETQKDHCCHL